MSILGIELDRTNPEFTKQIFCVYMPQFTKFFFSDLTTTPWTENSDNDIYWQEYYDIANKKIFHSIYGIDWKLAMSLCIAHYLTLLSRQMATPSGSTLAEIAGGGTPQGILSSASVGNFNKQYNLDMTFISTDESKWWNQTKYGADLMALLKTKAIPSVFVVTPNPII